MAISRSKKSQTVFQLHDSRKSNRDFVLVVP